MGRILRRGLLQLCQSSVNGLHRSLKNGHILTERMMDHQYGENGARNIYSNYNQMKAYVECSPNLPKRYTLSIFPSSNRRNFEDSGKVLAVSVSEFYQTIAVEL